MGERILHFINGPLDGLTGLIDEQEQAFMMSLNTDTDGYYALEYDAALVQTSSGLTLSDNDVIARWHPRSNVYDYQIGDTVIMKNTGLCGKVVAPVVAIDANKIINWKWAVDINSALSFVEGYEIRIATADELRDDT